MKGLWLEDGKVSFRNDLPTPDPAPGEALVRVIRAGICNTDLELVRGYYPYRGVLGHEFVGRVEQGPPTLVGRRVVGEINAVCGSCIECACGNKTHCQQRSVLGIVNRDGAFAEYLVLPIENLFTVPEEVSTDVATFTEPLAAALEIQQQLQIRPSDRVLVVGDGKLGLLIAQTLQLTGCRLLALGRHPNKLALLEARNIATHCAVSTGAEGIQQRSYDLAVECTGSRAGFEAARRALRPRGTLVLKSTYRGELTIDASAIVVDELTLVGSRCGPFAPALELLEERRVDVESMIHARYSLEEGLEAFERAARSGVLKVLFDR